MAGRLKGDADRDAFGVDSYYERGTTTTRANTTLFVAFPRDTAVLAEARAAYCERLFGETPNYVGVRQVRNLCFVDYEDVKSATAAMMKNQGHEGLTIDYDKDSGVASKRKREREEATKVNHEAAQSGSYYCASCGTKALRTSGALLSAMPTRSTGDRVVDEQANLLQLLLEPIADAQPALVRREKGTEKQFRLGCRSCSAFIAYRSVAEAAPGKYLFVLPTAISERPPTRRGDEAQQRRRVLGDVD